MKDRIPEEFYKAKLDNPYVETVGDLIKELQRLPPELEIKQGFEDGAELAVYNVSTEPVLEIIEAED